MRQKTALFMTAILLTAPLVATPKSVQEDEEARSVIIVKLLAYGALVSGINWAFNHNRLGNSRPMQAVADLKAPLTLAIIFHALGNISSYAPLKDVGVMIMLAAAGNKIARHRYTQNIVTNIPIIGDHLEAHNPVAIGIETVAFYQVLKTAYPHVIKKLDAAYAWVSMHVQKKWHELRDAA